MSFIQTYFRVYPTKATLENGTILEAADLIQIDAKLFGGYIKSHNNDISAYIVIYQYGSISFDFRKDTGIMVKATFSDFFGNVVVIELVSSTSSSAGSLQFKVTPAFFTIAVLAISRKEIRNPK